MGIFKKNDVIKSLKDCLWGIFVFFNCDLFSFFWRKVVFRFLVGMYFCIVICIRYEILSDEDLLIFLLILVLFYFIFIIK